jgi:hypothetical protein
METVLFLADEHVLQWESHQRHIDEMMGDSEPIVACAESNSSRQAIKPQSKEAEWQPDPPRNFAV